MLVRLNILVEQQKKLLRIEISKQGGENNIENTSETIFLEGGLNNKWVAKRTLGGLDCGIQLGLSSLYSHLKIQTS